MAPRVLKLGIAALFLAGLGWWLHQSGRMDGSSGQNTPGSAADAESVSRRILSDGSVQDGRAEGFMGTPAPQSGEPPPEKKLEEGIPNPNPYAQARMAQAAGPVSLYYSTSSARWTELHRTLRAMGALEMAEEIRLMQLELASDRGGSLSVNTIAERTDSLLGRIRGALPGDVEALREEEGDASDCQAPACVAEDLVNTLQESGRELLIASDSG